MFPSEETTNVIIPFYLDYGPEEVKYPTPEMCPSQRYRKNTGIALTAAKTIY